MNVSDPSLHPAFPGTVGSVDTTGYRRPLSASPGGQSFHYNNNAETDTLTGDAMGRELIKLLETEIPGHRPPKQTPFHS